MNTVFLDKCAPFLSSEHRPGEVGPRASPNGRRRPIITISRQTGSGAHSVGERLVQILQERAPGDEHSWRLLDRDLVDKVLEDHHHPQRFARFMPEDRISEVADAMDELLGGHPPSRILVEQTVETVLHLAQQGNVVLIGRAANIITRGMGHAFHVRLVGSLPKRIERLRAFLGMNEREAREFILKEDRGRLRYVKKYFDHDLDDPLLYHLVINTDLVTRDEIARIISQAMLASHAVARS